MNEEIKVLNHLIEFYEKFCENEEELNPIITNEEIKALKKILKHIDYLKSKGE